MRITVFGSSGKSTTGRFFVEQALAANHHVTVLVRSLDRFQIRHPQDNLVVVQGDALLQEDVEKVITKETEVAVTSIGSDTLGHTTVCSVESEWGLRSVIVRPGGLTDGKANGKYKLGPHSGGMVSRGDVAGLLLRLVEDCTLFETWMGKALTVAN
ncbi:hypothetical protein HDV05_007379 [Chytridiales sp. JEL 0842]|nr:hypothetical protein HDV05_007379 [Chytridiales sp. JEL 0842]